MSVFDIASSLATPPLPAPVRTIASDSAYIIFTSGSTGEPKGVDVAHAAAWNTIHAINERFDIDQHDRVIGLSGLEFDLSVYDIFGILSVGGALVVVDETDRRDPAAWLKIVNDCGVSIWNSVPTLLEMAVSTAGSSRGLDSIRLALVSGDWVPLPLPQQVRAVCRSPLRFVALGGATEAAIWSNAIEVEATPKDWPSIPYGFPLPNQRFRVVDSLGRDCPDYVAGELWIGGAGLAKGYTGAPELTTERFVSTGQERWYRTGDRGRYWRDGTLEFLGRLDRQVKVRGHRIELGEIEVAIERHPAVERAVAVVVGEVAGRTLVAACSLNARASAEEILSSARAELPSHMVPQRLEIVDGLPLTSNGKIDRVSVARLVEQQTVHIEAQEPPQGATEMALARLWSDVLHVPAVDRHLSFFELGGNSLQAVRLAARINQDFGASLPLRTFLADSTLAAIARQIDLTTLQRGPAEEGIV